jgi:hypothetical protein
VARKLEALLHWLWLSGEVYESLHISQTAMTTAAYWQTICNNRRTRPPIGRTCSKVVGWLRWRDICACQFLNSWF